MLLFTIKGYKGLSVELADLSLEALGGYLGL